VLYDQQLVADYGHVLTPPSQNVKP